MKKICGLIMIALTALFTGCEKETELDTSSSASVKTLLYPADGYAVELGNTDFSKLTFEWEEAEKGTSVPSYNVIFYASDKTSEIGDFLSDGNGMKTMLTLTYPEILEMAEIAGIEPGGTGDIYWTVAASVGQNRQEELPEMRRLVLTRDGAELNPPTELYLTGEGSEAGANIEDALEMTATGEGKFEIFAKINGSFSLVNRVSEGGKRTFYVAEDGALTTVAENAASFSESVYLIKVDFTESKAEMIQVGDVQFQSARGDVFGTMQYAGNGTWEMENFTIHTVGSEDRYRFKTMMDGEECVWGSKGRGEGITEEDQRDNVDPGTVDSRNGYFDIYIQNTRVDDSYGWVWKFHGPTIGAETTVLIHMNGGRHYHEFDFGFDADNVPVVTRLVSPDDNARIRLNSDEGSEETFSWEKPSESPALMLTSYTLVFFKDADGNETVSPASFEVGYETGKTFSHSELEAIAEAAGIPASGTGTIYWGVKTTLFGKTAMSERINALSISRIPGVPQSLYLTGDGTEFGAEYGSLRNLGGGKFEIYAKLSDGAFVFTDRQGDDARTFVLSGNSFVETEDVSSGLWRDGEQVCRIRIDCVNWSVTLERIGEVYFQSCVDKDNHIILDYVGKGVWEKNNFTPDFTKQFNDSRFFVKMNIDGKEWKLANQENFGDEDPKTAAPEGSPEYAVKFWDDNDDWKYHYKVIESYRGQNDKRLNLKLNCSPDVDFYYVHCEYLDN